GAFLALGIVFAWSVIAYFRESVGSLVPRLVGIAACVPSFCALTSLASDPHEFWAGSVGIWMGDLCFRGFGPFLAWTVMGTLFLVSFALATEFGFQQQWAALRGTLAFPLVPPAEPEEPAAPEAPAPLLSQVMGTAVLEPGVAEPAEPWALPQPDLGGGGVPEPEFLDEEFSDAAVIDREQHLVDVRRRMAAGEAVTDAERRLVAEDRDRVEMGAAIDALFSPPPTHAPLDEPTLTMPGTPVKPVAALPDLPPFLLPTLYSQQMATDAPSSAPSAAAEGTPAAFAPAPSGSKHPTEDFGEPPIPLPAARSSYVFAGVEFLPPNEELADPDAEPAPAEAAVAEPEPAVAEPAASAGIAAMPAADAAPALAPSFEDEVYAFGLMPDESPSSGAATATPEQHAAASAAAFTEEVLPEIPAAVAEAIAAPVPVEEAAPVDDGSWLLAAARDLGLEPVAEVEPALAAEPAASIDEDLSASWEIPARGGLSAEEAAEAIVASLRDLFGDPIALPPSSAPDGATEGEPVPVPVVEAEVVDELLPFMDSPVAASDAPTHAPPPAPSLPDATLLPAFAASPASTDDAPVFDPGEEILTPDPIAPREYEPEPMTIEPGYIPNQDPEPGEIVRFETPSETLAAARAASASAEATVDRSADTDGQQFVEETISPPEFELAPEPGEESSPADAVLAKLFGEPMDEAPSSAPSAATEGTPTAAAPAVEASPAPVGPVQPEPREPPANLQPIIEEVVERVTLLNDPDFPDCARDHGIEEDPLNEQVFLPPPDAVVVDSAAVVDEVFEEPAVDEALVSRLVDEFRTEAPVAAEPVVETPAVEEVQAPAAMTAPAGADALYLQAVAVVRERGRGSVIILQRKLGIGYTRAVRILEQLLRNGVVGPENASGSHPVL
ncbi:MAG TPA: DNA translocase FtsK, partial [Planctomycetota bacterium]|nr:DNA translocase FtsK [Planctomycetota bacterium]